MAWYFKAIEQAQGRWACRFGAQDLGTYPNLTVALHQMVEAAVALGGRQHFAFHLHYLDGGVEVRPGADPVPGEDTA